MATERAQKKEKVRVVTCLPCILIAYVGHLQAVKRAIKSERPARGESPPGSWEVSDLGGELSARTLTLTP